METGDGYRRLIEKNSTDSVRVCAAFVVGCTPGDGACKSWGSALSVVQALCGGRHSSSPYLLAW